MSCGCPQDHRRFDQPFLPKAATASADRRVISAQLPSAIAFSGATHEPPTHRTFFSARKSAAFFSDTPPVGQNLTCGSGPPMPFRYGTPPAGTAGKNFRWVKPHYSARITSDEVATPGSSGRAS